MIEYLNAIASVLVILVTIVFLLSRPLDFEKINQIKDEVKSWKDELEFLGNIPNWYQLYNNITANKRKLEDDKNKLRNRLIDVRIQVEEREFETGRRRKREVDNWLSSTEVKCNEVEDLLQEIARSDSNYFWKFVHLAWLGNVVEKKIREVDDLLNSGSFGEVLSPVEDTLTLLTTRLVGNTAEQNIKTILGWLNNGVTKVGVHGIKGIGKTELVKHVYNQLSRNFDVYMVTLPENCEEYHEFKEYYLQSKIAEVIKINLQEEDGPKRAAVLHRALQRKNFVLILDGVEKYFSEEVVGIPLDPTKGKMIITSRSPGVCRKIGCQRNMIAVDPLPDEDAFQLFKQAVQVELSENEVIAREIVARCQGVPLKINKKAIKHRGVDVSLWTVEENTRGDVDD